MPITDLSSQGRAMPMHIMIVATRMMGLRRPILSEIAPEVSEATSDTTMITTDMEERTAPASATGRPMYFSRM